MTSKVGNYINPTMPYFISTFFFKLKFCELKTALKKYIYLTAYIILLSVLPSFKAPLGLLFKNENTNDDMIDILTELHQRYLPVMKTTDGSSNVEIEVLQKVFFGGDQLTEERARNAKQGRADGDTEFERLEGLIPKVEDWHAGRVLYQVGLLLT